MGEVVEDANISQQHLQVASTVVVDDEDEDDADNVREKLKEYNESLANLSLRPLDCTDNNDKVTSSRDGDNNTNSTAKNSSKGLPSKNAICPFTHLLPTHLERRRRILNKKYLQALKRVSEKGGPQLPQLKAKKEYELRFLEATYIRNVLYQSLPRLPTTSTAATTPCLVNNVSGDRSSRVTSDNNTNHNRLHNDSEGRTFSNSDNNDDDPRSKNAAVPRPSAISDKKPNSGVWLNCLKSKAMNDREPNHLIQVAYDNYVLNEGKRLWLSKQSKKKRSPPSVSEKTTGATSVTSSKLENNCIDDKKSSPTRNSSKLVNDSRNTASPQITTAAKLLLMSVESPSSEAVPQQKEKLPPTVLNVTQMRPRSLEGKEKESQDQKSSTTNEETNSKSASTAVEISTVEETRSSTPIAASVSKEEFEKGRKTALSYLSAALKNSSKGIETGKVSSATSLSSSDSSLKTTIVENTDSSSSSTCTSASSNSFSDNASILRGQNDTPSPTNGGAPATPTSGGSNKSNLSSSDTNTSVSTLSSNHGSTKSNKKLTPGPKAPKKYSEKMKAEASVLQRISELQKEGMWWERRLPKVYEPPKTKSHWDYLLEEMTWLSADFVHERKWKRSAAKRVSIN